MADDVMSQSEIDALLGEMVAKPGHQEPLRLEFTSVRTYDFRHPNKLSKDQIRTLQMIYESFARRAASTLSSALRSVMSINLVSIEQSVFDDYLRGLPATTVMNIASQPPLPGAMILEFSMDLAFMFLDRLLGGKGRPFHREGAVTDIEEELLRSITLQLLSSLAASWSDLTPVTPSLDSVEYSPRFMQIAGRNEVVILLVFDVRLFEMQATMSMCVPYPMIEPIVPKLTAQLLFSGSAKSGRVSSEEVAGARLNRVRIPISVELGQTYLSLDDVVQVQTGDIIRLDTHVSDSLPVIVNGRTKFRAQAGILGRHLGARIEEVVTETEETER